MGISAGLKQLLILFALTSLGLSACDHNALRSGKTEKQRADTRPGESGEGLPGYLHCQKQALPDSAEEPGELRCRLAADGEKLDISNDELQWNFTSPVKVSITWKEMPPADPWHVSAFFQSSEPTLVVAAMDAAVIELQYQDTFVKKPVAETLQAPTADSLVFNDGIRLQFSNGGESLAGWLAINSNQQSENRINVESQSELGQVPVTIRVADGQSFEWRRIGWEITGPSPWTELGQSALSSNSDITFELSGLQATSYRVYVVSTAWQDFSGIGTQVIAADIWRDGAYQRISPEATIPVHPQTTPPTMDQSGFAILDFEGAVSSDGRLQFIVRRLRADDGPITINAIIIHPYR